MFRDVRQCLSEAAKRSLIRRSLLYLAHVGIVETCSLAGSFPIQSVSAISVKKGILDQ